MERATSFLYYAKGGNVRQLLYELKYHGNQEVEKYGGEESISWDSIPRNKVKESHIK